MSAPRLRVAVVADDLIWSTRLVELVRRAGAEPVTARDAPALVAATPGIDAAIVDLTARAYDGVEQVALAAAAGLRVLAVGQHDDRELRERARAAGAERVVPYRRLMDGGQAVLASWLRVAPPEPPAAAAVPGGSGAAGRRRTGTAP